MMTQRRRSGKLQPIHSPRSETLNEQLRRAESLLTDTRKFTKNIHSVEGERGEEARVTGEGARVMTLDQLSATSIEVAKERTSRPTHAKNLFHVFR